MTRPDSVTEFVEKHGKYNFSFVGPIDDQWKNNNVSHIRVSFKTNTDKMLEECKSIADRFVPHRKGDYAHEGWESITLHGIAEDKTEDFGAYGFSSFEEADYKWTGISAQTPEITNFVKGLPYEFYKRVRIMKLKAGGYIAPHNDGEGRLMGPLNFAINNPNGCCLYFENKGLVPFSAGIGYFIDVGRKHCVVNDSNEDRYHIIIHGRKLNNYKEILWD